VYPDTNALDISGFWYAYGDRYDVPSRCTKIGMHAPADCARVDSPAPLPNLGFVNYAGQMCTAGHVAIVSDCVSPDVLGCAKGGPDYSNIWGAGIGLDFNLELPGRDDPGTFTRDPLKRQGWDAPAHGVSGISFDFHLLDGAAVWNRLRVEVPFILPENTRVPADKVAVSLAPDVPPVVAPGVLPDQPAPSEEHPSGSPFWGAQNAWGADNYSHVREGHNELRFDDLRSPPEAGYGNPDLTQLLGVQFHIYADNLAALDYGFCVSNFAFSRD
jgi:hypothetical protein